MLALKRFMTVVVMVYLLLALLFFLVPAVRATVAGLSSNSSPLEQERQFFYWLAAIGAVVLALHLLTENADSALLRRQVSQSEGKINELKAKLYDHQQTLGRPASTASRRVETPPPPSSGFTISANPDAIPRTNPYGSPRVAGPDADRPVFPQSDPSLSNTPPADRPPL